MSDRPSFTRKTRTRLSAEDRARMLADLAGTPETDAKPEGEAETLALEGEQADDQDDDQAEQQADAQPENAPVPPAPVPPAPDDDLPEDTLLSEPLPEDTLPEDTLPEDVSPEDAAPKDAPAQVAAPDNAIPVIDLTPDAAKTHKPRTIKIAAKPRPPVPAPPVIDPVIETQAENEQALEAAPDATTPDTPDAPSGPSETEKATPETAPADTPQTSAPTPEDMASIEPAPLEPTSEESTPVETAAVALPPVETAPDETTQTDATSTEPPSDDTGDAAREDPTSDHPDAASKTGAPTEAEALPPATAVPPEPAPETVADPISQPVPEAPQTPDRPDPAQIWVGLPTIPVDAAHLERNLIITAGRHDPAHGAFDVLRTRLVQTLKDHGWKRVAVTSPSRDCGKTFTAVNLAISLSRYEAMRTLLLDMDMRNPSVAGVIGAQHSGSMGDFLQGLITPAQHFQRLGRNALNIGANLAVALNDRIEPYASELMNDPLADAALARMMDDLAPDVVLYDLPPALAFDDVIAFRKHFDGILMVIGGGRTRADEVHEVMRRLGDDVPLLGVVLNQSEGETRAGYTYGY